MAEINATEQFNIEAIAVHLRKCPFALIFGQSSEKDDHVALKLMCIVDYKTKRWDLYSRIKDNPKLLEHLMQFRSYGQFKYYDCQVGHKMGKRVLKCKFCELVGPYGYIFTHMAINHNAHIGLKVCCYCNGTDLRKHFDDNSLQQCYRNYIQRNKIHWNENVCSVVTEFYDMLKSLADKFKINTVRNHSFGGKGYGAVEYLHDGDDSDIDDAIKVYRNRTPDIKSKNISGRLIELNREFNRVISKSYGGNNASRLWQQSVAGANANGNGVGDLVDVSEGSDDNEDDGRATFSTTQTTVVAAAAAANQADNQASTSFIASGEGASKESEPTVDGFKTTPNVSGAHTSMGSTKAEPKAADAIPKGNLLLRIKRKNRRKSASKCFGKFVAQRLDQLPDEERRKLEDEILKVIAKSTDQQLN